MVIIQFYFQCAQMTTNNMSTSDGLNIGYKHLYKSRTTLINNRKNKTKRKIFSKLTINTTKWRHWYYIRSFRPKLGQNENKIAPNESLFYKPLTPLFFTKVYLAPSEIPKPNRQKEFWEKICCTLGSRLCKTALFLAIRHKSFIFNRNIPDVRTNICYL